MILSITPAAGAAIFLIHPPDKANRPFRVRTHLSDYAHDVHCDSHAGGIIESPSSQIPGVEVCGHNHYLLREFCTLEIGDDIVALRGCKVLWREHEVNL